MRSLAIFWWRSHRFLVTSLSCDGPPCSRCATRGQPPSEASSSSRSAPKSGFFCVEAGLLLEGTRGEGLPFAHFAYIQSLIVATFRESKAVAYSRALVVCSDELIFLAGQWRILITVTILSRIHPASPHRTALPRNPCIVIGRHTKYNYL